MKNNWTNKEIEELRKLYPVTPIKQLSKLIGKTVPAIRSKVKILKIKKHHLYKGNQWSIQKDEILIKLYETHTSKEIGAILNIPYTTIKNRAHKLGLRKNTNSGCFKKGHIPANKGQKMSKEIYEKAKPSFYKKGHKPHNTLYDGAISIRKDKKSGISYKYIRVAEGEWKLLHRFKYEEKYGKIPSNIFLRCKDGNQLNCDPDNWEPIDMRKNMELNRIDDLPPELQEVIRLNNKLKKLINEKH